MSNAFTSLSKIEELTTEVVQYIAQYLDDDTLLNFSALSRTLRAKSHFTYGRRFFTTRNFCFHPISLQGLTQIASAPALAKYVKTVSFGTGHSDTIDPVHDEDVKVGSANHGLVLSEPLDDQTLEQVRLRVDSSIIAQALTKLPVLEMVIASRRSDSARKLFRKVYKDKQPHFTCVSGHCRLSALGDPPASLQRVFKVVAMALEQMRPERLGLEIGLDDYRHNFYNATNSSNDVWYTGGYALERITLLRVSTSSNRHLTRSPIYQIFSTAPIESLEIGCELDQYVSSHKTEADPFHLLQSLQRLSITKLLANNVLFQKLFQAHENRLTHVTITDYSVVWPNRFHSPNNGIREDWVLILLELQKMAHLDSLHLEKLESTTTMAETTPLEGDQCLDTDMAIKAVWRSGEEIQIGIQSVLQNYCVLAHPLPLDPGPWHPERYYLNLRYANLKVSPRYRLTEAEIKALEALRAERRRISPNGLLPAIFEVMNGKDPEDAPGRQSASHPQGE